MLNRVQIGSSATTLIALAASENEYQRFKVFSIQVCNISSTDEVIQLYLIPNGEVLGDDYKIEKDFLLKAGKSAILDIPYGLILEGGDSVQAVGATGGLVNSIANYIYINVSLK